MNSKKGSRMLQLAIKIFIPYIELTVVRLDLVFVFVSYGVHIYRNNICNYSTRITWTFTTRRSSDTDTELKKYTHT